MIHTVGCEQDKENSELNYEIIIRNPVKVPKATIKYKFQ